MECKCGCGEEVSENRCYVRGHNFINTKDRELFKVGMKECKRCKEIKTILDFYKRPDRGTYVSYCNSCSIIMVNEFKNKNPEYEKIYSKKNKDRDLIKKRIQRRRTILKTGGIKYTGLNKRPYPLDDKCEICGKIYHLHMPYHHWDDNNKSKGIWVCMLCHGFIECIDKNIQVSTYLNLKQIVEEQYEQN